MLLKKLYLAVLLLSSSILAYTQANNASTETKPRVLLIHTLPFLGGGEIHTLNLLEQFKLHNYHVDIVVTEHSALSKILEEKGIKHYTIVPINQKSLKKINNQVSSICKQNNISLIYCNRIPETQIASKAIETQQVKTILTFHSSYRRPTKNMQGIDGIIVIDPRLVRYFDQSNKRFNLNVKYIEHIPPIFNSDKFIEFQSPQLSRKNFFMQKFGVDINNEEPLILAVGNIYKNLKEKNYPLLLKAVRILNKRYNKSVNVAIAGDGPARSIIENLIIEMKLEKKVNLLGFTDEVDNLLHYADIFVSASSHESWGIVLLEASLMKKPVIASLGTGAEFIVQHEQTGRLFIRDDAQDLAKQLNIYLSDQEHRQTMAENGYHRVRNYFSAEKIFEQIEAFQNKLFKKIKP